MRQRVAHPSLIRTQSGIAALEFALIAALMISMLMASWSGGATSRHTKLSPVPREMVRGSPTA